MEKEIIIEGNKAIAKFLGYEEAVTFRYRNQVWHHIDDKWFYSQDLQYHSSWDWLMPVVKKLENLYEDGVLKISDGYQLMSEKLNSAVVKNYEIAEIWSTVVELVNCLNDTTTNYLNDDIKFSNPRLRRAG